MKSKKLLSAGILVTTVLCGTVHARSISTDMWNDVQSNVTGTTANANAGELTYFNSSALTGLSELSLSPGLVGVTSTYDAGETSGMLSYSWGGPASSSALPPGSPDAREQVLVNSQSAGTFSVSFNYAPGFGAAGDKPSLTFETLNSAKNNYNEFTATYSGATAPDAFSASYDLTFSGGVLTANEGGWTITEKTNVGPTAAPEIDPASVSAGLTLLLGSLIALRGRRSVKLVRDAA